MGLFKVHLLYDITSGHDITSKLMLFLPVGPDRLSFRKMAPVAKLLENHSAKEQV